MMVFLVAMIVVSCSNGNNPIDEDDTNETIFLNCEPVFDDGNYFTNYEEILDTTGLKLYPFIPFTDEWGPGKTDYSELLEARQIPEDFMRGMTTKALFYQVVYNELFPTLGMYNSIQYGFEENVKQLNMLPELLNHPDAGHVLLELLQKVDPSIIKLDMSRDPNEWWWFSCLQLIGAQMEVINRMSDEDICAYIHHNLRCIDIMQSLDDYHPGNSGLLASGLGTVMISYEFEPFLQTLRRHPVTNEFLWGAQFLTEEYVLQVIDYIKQFIKAD